MIFFAAFLAFPNLLCLFGGWVWEQQTTGRGFISKKYSVYAPISEGGVDTYTSSLPATAIPGLAQLYAFASYNAGCPLAFERGATRPKPCHRTMSGVPSVRVELYKANSVF